MWVPASRNSIEQKVAKASKGNVLRRSGIQGELGRANIVYICRSHGANPLFFHSYKYLAPTEQIPLGDLCALLFNSEVWPRSRLFCGTRYPLNTAESRDY
jgi:hypothetical protein